MALTTVPVTGQINGPADSHFAAEFIRPGWLVSAADDAIESARVIYADVADDGSFTVNLPATDQPGYVPTGWTYRVILTCGNRRTVGTLAVPYNSGGFDLADRINLDDPPETGDTYVTLGMRGAANGVAALDGTGKVPAAQLPAASGGAPAWSEVTGKPEEFPPADHTHAIVDVSLLSASLLDIATDVDVLDTRVTALEDAPGGGGGSTITINQDINTTAGNIVPQAAAAWAAVTGGPTISIAAAVGDYVALDVLGSLVKALSNTFLELCVLVGGAPVRYGSTGTATPATEGDPAFYADVNFTKHGLGMGLVVAPGDLSGGTVTFGFATKGVGTGTTIYSSTDYPLRWRAMNYGAVTVS